MKYSKFYKNPFLRIRNSVQIERLNQFVDHGKKNKLIGYSEKNYHKQITELVKDLFKNKNKSIIRVAGPTSSGKTTTANVIKHAIERKNRKATIISLDDFLLPLAERKLLPNGELDYESIDTIDNQLLSECFKALLENGKAEMPEYDFVKGARKPETNTLTLEKGDYIIVEGLHALNPILFDGFEDDSYTVYICPYKDYYFKRTPVLFAREVRLMRRCLRDHFKRGQSVEETIKMWYTITQSEDIFVKPYRFTCDYFINSAIDYELCLYAQYLKPLLENVKDQKSTWPFFKVLDKIAILNIADVPRTSLLWEFLE